MSEAYRRAVMLMQQGRSELAVAEFRKHLATEPNDAMTHALLGMCLSELKQYGEASDHCAEAIRLDPDNPFPHYTAGHVFVQRNRFKEALAAAQEAIRLDPDDADYHGLLALVHLNESRHEQALAAAESGLQADPQHVNCQNYRAMALKNLGRHDEAAGALDSAFARDPENAWTHANKGWALLEKNDADGALRHFQEALRIDPELDWAREGIVTALKARYKLYGIFLKYFLWMSKLSSQQQWMVILGVWFGSRALGSFGRSNPEWQPYVEPARTALFALILMTWIADPLFNLALRLNHYGRLALNRDQVRASNLVGLFVGLTLIAVILSLTVYSGNALADLVALGLAVMIIPISAIYRCHEGWRRKFMGWYSIVLVACGATAAISAGIIGSQKPSEVPALYLAFVVCGLIFLGGIILASFGANILMTWRPKR